jgi:hypothetical protein
MVTRRLYVYYRVDEAALAATVAAVHALQMALCATHPGLSVGLQRRPETALGQVTLMETYAGAVTLDLRQALDKAAAGLPQPRHNEVFDALI